MRPDDLIMLLDTLAIIAFAGILITLVVHTERKQDIGMARRNRRNRRRG